MQNCHDNAVYRGREHPVGLCVFFLVSVYKKKLGLALGIEKILHPGYQPNLNLEANICCIVPIPSEYFEEKG